MAVLRELVSRFSFETDKKSVNKFESTVGGMKGSLKNLAATFGIAIGGKALFNMGVSAKQAEENLKQAAGIDFDNINNSLLVMRERLNGVQDGASNIIREKTLNVLARSFVKEYGSAAEEVKLLVKLLETASLQKLATGESIEETFSGFMTAIKAGDLSQFVGIADFDIQRKREREFVLSAQDPLDPTGRIGQAQRKSEVSNIIDSLLQELRGRAASVSPELVTISVGKEILLETAEKAGEAVTIAGVKSALSIIKEVQKSTEQREKQPSESFLDGLFSGVSNIFNQGVEGIKQRRSENEVNKQNVEINSVFHINGAENPKETAEIVDRKISVMIEDANNQIIRQEVR